jgi:hypothetical protein
MDWRSVLRANAAMFVAASVLASGCIRITPPLELRDQIHPEKRYEAVALGGFQHEGRLQELLRTGVEVFGLARRVDPNASIRIEGRILESGPSTGGAKLGWNVVNTVLLLFLFGGPYLGSCSATAELRVFDADQLVVTHQGRAEADWRVHYEVIPRIIDARKRAVQRAEKLAVWRATEELSEKTWP